MWLVLPVQVFNNWLSSPPSEVDKDVDCRRARSSSCEQGCKLTILIWQGALYFGQTLLASQSNQLSNLYSLESCEALNAGRSCPLMKSIVQKKCLTWEHPLWHTLFACKIAFVAIDRTKRTSYRQFARQGTSTSSAPCWTFLGLLYVAVPWVRTII